MNVDEVAKLAKQVAMVTGKDQKVFIMKNGYSFQDADLPEPKDSTLHGVMNGTIDLLNT